MNQNDTTALYTAALQLLQELIRIPSFSKAEQGAADCIESWLSQRDIPSIRVGHNICARNRYYDPEKPVIMLNSHHDTVKPNQAYTRDPFSPDIIDNKLYGLGSNDAGGCLVSLISTFYALYDREDLPYNLVLAATAEEEISGQGGISALLQDKAFQDYTAYDPDTAKEQWSAIIGEPTEMELAIAERGLMVIDAYTEGLAGHAARSEGVNALYKAIADIQTLQQYRFEQVSPYLGSVQLQVTAIHTDNQQHNVVPATCHYIIDVRLNECYDMATVLQLLRDQVSSRLQPRSMRLRSTAIAPDHPLVLAGRQAGAGMYGSPTTSDKALIPFPGLKTGPGHSARSHMADEYILLTDIQKGITGYLTLLDNRIRIS